MRFRAQMLILGGTLMTVVSWAFWTPLLLRLCRSGAIPPLALPLVVGSLVTLIAGVLRLWRGKRATATLTFHIVLAALTALLTNPVPPNTFAGPLLLGIVVAFAGLSGVELRARP